MSSKLASEFCAASIELLDQSMIKIRHCLGQLSESQIWWRAEPSVNSVGNLCVHMEGNLRQWGVVPFSDAVDQRNREAEFTDTLRVAAKELLCLLENVVVESSRLWRELDEKQLLTKTTIQGFTVTRLHAISHTSSHFVGHTHQIISLTRIQLGGDYRFQWTPEQRGGGLPI